MESNQLETSPTNKRIEDCIVNSKGNFVQRSNFM